MATATTLRIGVSNGELGERYFEEVEAAFREHATSLECVRVTVGSEGSARTGIARSRPRKKDALNERLCAGLADRTHDVAVVDLSSLTEPLPPNIELAGVTSRRTPYYALVSRHDMILDELLEGATVGVDRPERYGQLLFFQPELKLVPIRGRVSSLIAMVSEQDLPAIILPADELERLGFQEAINEILTEEILLPLAGRGCLGLLVRARDKKAAGLVQKVNHEASWDEIQAERSFVRRLEGFAGYSTGVLARVIEKTIRIEGAIALEDGSSLVRTSLEGQVGKEEELGIVLADKLLKEGGADILKRTGYAAGGRG